MLPKKNRLNRREDFAVLYAKGAYASVYDGIAIKFLPTENPEVRVGFPIGKNFSKKAVTRNRARRILRAASFQLLASLKPGFDILVMPKPGKAAIEFNETIVVLRRVFLKANLFM